MGKFQVTKFERGRATEMSDQGASIRSIAVVLSKSFGSVRNYFKDSDLYAARKPSGRPKKLTALDARRVIRHAHQEPGIHSIMIL